MRRAVTTVATLLTVVLGLAGCGFNPERVDLSMSSGGHELRIQFDSVLNLPVGARVSMRGADIGRVTRTELAGPGAVAVCQVHGDVPQGTRAELKQTTALGDIYISLTPGPAGSPVIPADGVIPVADTYVGAQVEDTLSTMSTFINGGSITALQDALNQVEQQFPQSLPESRALASFVSTQIRGAGQSIPDIGRLLGGTQRVADMLQGLQRELAFMFSEQGRVAMSRLNPNLAAAFGLFTGMKAILDAAVPLTPFLTTLNTFLNKVIPLIREPSARGDQFPGNMQDFINVFASRIGQFWRNGGNVNVAQLAVGTQAVDAGRLQSVTQLLRMIGVVR